MLKKKGVFDAMRACEGSFCCFFCSFVDLAAALQESSSAYPVERMTAVWRGLYASFKGFVETHCGDTDVTLPTVPSSTEVTDTTVPFPLLPYDTRQADKARDTLPVYASS